MEDLVNNLYELIYGWYYWWFQEVFYNGNLLVIGLTLVVVLLIMWGIFRLFRRIVVRNNEPRSPPTRPQPPAPNPNPNRPARQQQPRPQANPQQANRPPGALAYIELNDGASGVRHTIEMAERSVVEATRADKAAADRHFSQVYDEVMVKVPLLVKAGRMSAEQGDELMSLATEKWERMARETLGLETHTSGQFELPEPDESEEDNSQSPVPPQIPPPRKLGELPNTD